MTVYTLPEWKSSVLHQVLGLPKDRMGMQRREPRLELQLLIQQNGHRQQLKVGDRVIVKWVHKSRVRSVTWSRGQ